MLSSRGRRPLAGGVTFVVVAVSVALFAVAGGAEPVAGKGSKPLQFVKERQKGVAVGVRKIFGGKPAKWGEHKWQVALLASDMPDNADAQFCGGSLVKPNWVVTAAHCVDGGTKPGQVDVLSGTSDLQSGGKRTKSAAIFVHRAYTPEQDAPFVSAKNDIALIKLSEQATGEAITFLQASEAASKLKDGDEVTVSGWGLTELGSAATKLKEVSVPVVPFKKCNGPASYDGQITDKMFCAGKDLGGQDSCKGDSGGPATVPGRLVGVVSWGVGCAEAYKYGVYTNIAKYESWLNKCIAEETSCEKQ